ncbi:MAG: restriction endonuclease, SacI family [Capnocytophaga felis]|nr:restriction endonuclease, SacI family [Capnocytophaga felis]
MNHKQKLIEIYNRSSNILDIKNIQKNIAENINIIAEKSSTQKGVYTVLITLLVHKILFPNQDIRRHQANMEGGFSGRSIDTEFITPTLKELNLPSMAESGWLTRSLEQPYPYTLDYHGKISNLSVKKAFLEILDFIEKNPKKSESILRVLFNKSIEIQSSKNIKIIPLVNPERLTIEQIINVLFEQFIYNYKTHGGSKLPVLAFYSIYSCLIKELARYKGKRLGELGSHTASDRTSKSAGDIEIFENNSIFEAVEIKLNKQIDNTIVRVAIEKIYKHNPKRYYILSNEGIRLENQEEIDSLVRNVKNQHGCQIIINGLIPTLKYYLRLISNLEDFIKNYSVLIEKDKELQFIHKEKWNELINNFLNTRIE